ncbi:hypothetical protein HNO88_004280 [Novosphingobium chloroacetimidivorans]|uniref:DUF1449 family protein n=1 Tax=Novosphingobium chloroacetimidivorans TaxID=1428314 RepID=A0A7W7KET2_9SPHN|nr:OB-fold-containig protein [Novosphingobium chloroacetimidivorans]MBB4860934.1 hypothetical protein [Novosphingobium chloroacetimidivorans]
MFAQLLTPAYLPFVLSFLIMLGIGLIEAIGLGLGHLDLDWDSAVDDGGSVLAWLGLGGELPILIWLTSLLGCFTLSGLAVQQVASAVFDAPLHPGLAVVAALLVGTTLNTFVANGLARIMPGFETTVISTDDLLRRRGTILEGTARRGSPARAKVIDQHGQAHFIMLEPHDDAVVITAGETALLVRREEKLFYAVPDRPTLLEPI